VKRTYDTCQNIYSMNDKLPLQVTVTGYRYRLPLRTCLKSQIADGPKSNQK
jgi:hypothetical protein